ASSRTHDQPDCRHRQRRTRTARRRRGVRSRPHLHDDARCQETRLDGHHLGHARLVREKCHQPHRDHGVDLRPIFRRMKKVFIKTYGCQMNERDSEAVAAMLRERGYAIASSELDADVVLLNTCSVRDLAEQKALGKMSMLAHLKRQKPELILGYMGCMAQSRGAELLQNPAVDLVVGTQRFHHVPEYLDQLTGRAGCPQPAVEGESTR